MKWSTRKGISSRRSAKPGNHDGNDGKPMKEVFAESPLRDHRFKILRGRRNDPDIDLDPLRAPYPLELLVDKHAQDLALRFARHVCYLIQVQNAAMGLLQGADLALSTVRFRAEKFSLHPLRRDRGGIQTYKRTGTACGMGMNGAGDKFLAGALTVQ